MSADLQLREEIICAVQGFAAAGLGVGTAGNLSARSGSGFLITPSGVAYEELQAEMLVAMNADGEVIAGDCPPSSEWRFHKDIYRAHGEARAIVHVHSPFATALACSGRAIPAFHYMIAIAGGDSIRCAQYARFGTQELSDYAVQALEGRRACLLANHGMIALGEDVASALRMTLEVEELAKQYCLSLQIGAPQLLDKAEMRIILEKFKNYGRHGKP